ncbi:MAG: hypothetical protein IJS67_03170 [Clostridia bacterium]|nr:hypothetical protein [Clostridia bacterium]
MNSKAKIIAYLGVMTALIFTVLMLETYVFIFVIKPSPAFLTIPIAIALCLKGKKYDMFVGGTILGVTSFILSFIVGYTPFYNPLISVLPRVLIGVAAYFVNLLVTGVFKNSKSAFVRETLPLSIAGMAGVLTNTVLVITMLALFDFSGISAVFTTILSFNFLIEFVGGAVLVPVVVKVIRKIVRD